MVGTISSTLQVELPYLRPRLGSRCCSLPLRARRVVSTGPVPCHVHIRAIHDLLEEPLKQSLAPRLSLLDVERSNGLGADVENVASNICNHFPASKDILHFVIRDAS
jgi:hypothetical protein